MKELHTEIEILAPARRVWKVLTDFSSFPDWNPFIRQIRGEVEVGEQLEVYLQPPGAKGMRFQPTVLKVAPELELRWKGHLVLAGFFDGEHIFRIETLSENRVRFIQRERFSGLLLPLLAKQLDTDTRRGFEAMNQALKQRCEGI